MRPTAEDLAAHLGLKPHSEGGLFRETYRAGGVVETPRGMRAAYTTILFLVTAAAVRRLHRLSSDEIWVFQGGLPLEFITLAPGGELSRVLLGDAAEPDASDAERVVVPQALAPAGHWQGARLAGGAHLQAERAWCLLSCVVIPGFEYEDFEMGERGALLAAYPQHAEFVRSLT